MNRMCQTTREWLLLRLDGETSVQDERQLEEHLEHCTDCAVWWEDARLLIDHDESCTRECAPPELVAAVKDRWRSSKVNRPVAVRLRRILVPVALAAAASLALFFLPGNQIDKPGMEPTRIVAVTPAVTAESVEADPLAWDDEELNNTLSRVNSETLILRTYADPSAIHETELGRQMGTMDFTLSRLAMSIEEM